MKKILVICSTSPFKVSDGVTAALNSIKEIVVDLYVNVNLYVINENKLYDYKLKRKINREVCAEKINYNNYDIVIISPISSFTHIFKYLPLKKNFLLITQISDCIFYELWRSFILSVKFNKINFKPLSRLLYYYYKEYQISRISDAVLLQTKKDVKIFNMLYCTNKGFPFPNLPSFSKRCSIKIFSNNNIGWCASFTGEYLLLSKWFLKKVLHPFMIKNSNVTLNLAGVKNKDFGLYISAKYPFLKHRIVVNNYIDNILNFYKSNKVVVAPIFKGYGLINKTVEAMYSGSLVLGDASAFNGIENCGSMKNCIIANSPKEFLKELDFIFNEMTDSGLKKIVTSAQNTILNQFDKNNNKVILQKIIDK